MKKNRLELSPKELRAIQMVMLEMLIEVDRICRGNSIHYSLGCGTLLGAVREKGFIPWDDDADIFMLRDEYDRFCGVCARELDTERFFLQTWDTDPEYRIGFAKMRRNGTVYVRAGQEKMKYHGGIFIDIMPFDNVPDYYHIKRHKAFLRKCAIYRKVMYSLAGSMCEDSFVKRLGYKILSLYPKDKVKRAFEAYATAYNNKKTVGTRCVFGLGELVFDKSMFDTYEDMEFEGRQFMVMGGWEYYLRQAFGYYYMRRPPLDQRHGNAAISKFQLCEPIL